MNLFLSYFHVSIGVHVRLLHPVEKDVRDAQLRSPGANPADPRAVEAQRHPCGRNIGIGGGRAVGGAPNGSCRRAAAPIPHDFGLVPFAHVGDACRAGEVDARRSGLLNADLCVGDDRCSRPHGQDDQTQRPAQHLVFFFATQCREIDRLSGELSIVIGQWDFARRINQ